RAVIPLVTVPTIYEVPLLLEDAGLGNYIVERLGLSPTATDLEDWQEMVARIKEPKEKVSVAIVGKYVGLPDSYISVREALRHAAFHHHRDVEIEWINSEDLEKVKDLDALQRVQGILVPGGFDARGIEGKILAARYARENKIPYLGLCLGMQIMVIELARHALGSAEPNSTEFNPRTTDPVIDLLPEQKAISDKGGTMRLGSIPCRVLPGTLAARAYGRELISERRRHRFEVNNDYRDVLTRAGLIISGTSPDGRLVEIAEMAGHPFMLGTQFHPEFLSRPNRPAPLFRDLMGAVVARSEELKRKQKVLAGAEE
ncbi:MAG: CTP synthase, partial [Chloroflexi bacterium]|nr:CTP synthase [Chloroflexota bacterium]